MGNWIRTHFHTFVYPALAYAQFKYDSTNRWNSNYSADSASVSSFYPVNIEPSNSSNSSNYTKLPTELSKLRSLCDKLNINWNSLTYSQNYRGKVHFDVLRETLKSAERKRQVLGCSRLIFAGRDVWTLEIMARKRKLPSVYIPCISRKVAQHQDLLIQLLKDYKITGEELLVDTGFIGSIPMAINEALGVNLEFVLMSQTKKIFPVRPDETLEVVGRKPNCMDKKILTRPNQLFPQRKNARAEALDTEYLPKYFKSGTVIENKIRQFLSSPEEIVLAAIHTSNVWRGVKYGRTINGSILQKGDLMVLSNTS